MKVVVDHELCTGHGRCYTLAPEVFGSDDSGYVELLSSDGAVPTGLEAKARQAALNCPERALTVVD